MPTNTAPIQELRPEHFVPFALPIGHANMPCSYAMQLLVREKNPKARQEKPVNGWTKREKTLYASANAVGYSNVFKTSRLLEATEV
jgi:hypothetical protein